MHQSLTLKILGTMIHVLLVLTLSSTDIIMHAVTDFSDQPITVEVPANGDQRFTLSEFFTVVDDNIDEDEQSFAIVAEIGPDVPEKIKCFQFGVGEAGCRGRRGATEIRIYDNDRELFTYGSFAVLPWARMRFTVLGSYISVSVCSVCLSVTTFSATTRKKSKKER